MEAEARAEWKQEETGGQHDPGLKRTAALMQAGKDGARWGESEIAQVPGWAPRRPRMPSTGHEIHLSSFGSSAYIPVPRDFPDKTAWGSEMKWLGVPGWPWSPI